MQDFPAAHSMDTEWFAVDADGNIALFDSGEGGAVPESNDMLQKDAQAKGMSMTWYMNNIQALFWEWSRESSDRVVRIALPSDRILRVLGTNPHKLEIGIRNPDNIFSKIIPSSIYTSWIDEREISNPDSDGSWGTPNTHWLLVPSGNESPILEIVKNNALRDRDYVVLFSGEPTLIFLPQCPLTTVRMLLSKGHLQFALPLEAYRNGLATLLGLFSYWHDYSNLFPYECDGQPIYPLNLSDLPQKLQDVLAWNRFDNIRFSESRKIQPIEHTRCHTWYRDKWWVNTKGNEREGYPYDRS